jgi:hypothetical protein
MELLLYILLIELALYLVYKGYKLFLGNLSIHPIKFIKNFIQSIYTLIKFKKNKNIEIDESTKRFDESYYQFQLSQGYSTDEVDLLLKVESGLATDQEMIELNKIKDRNELLKMEIDTPMQ